MKTITHSLKLQRGVASLLTAVVLLTCITLVALFTSKTVVTETKTTADEYRTSQATSAAQAAMDQAFVYYSVNRTIDRFRNATTAPYALTGVAGADGAGKSYNPDYNITSPMAITLTAGSQTTTAQFYFNNTQGNICNNPAGFVRNKALIVATGWSDDGVATRTITQCVDNGKILKDKGPSQPVVTHGSIGIAGNATLINRFTNSNVWTGGSLGSAGAAFATYLRPADEKVTDLSWDELTAGCPNPCSPGSGSGSNHVRLVSNTKAGFSVDVIGDDPTLGNLTADELFALFFADSRTDVKDAAAENGQLFTGANISQAVGKEGLIWIEGNATATNIGVPPDTSTNPVTPAKPVVLIVNGDLTIGANIKIYGLVYVIGTLTINGSPEVFGSIISESGATSGNGSPTIVYVPWFGGGPSGEPPGEPAPIAGSWKDW